VKIKTHHSASNQLPATSLPGSGDKTSSPDRSHRLLTKNYLQYKASIRKYNTMMQITKRSMTGRSLPPKKKMKRSADFENATDPTVFIIDAFKDNGFSEKEIQTEAQSTFQQLTQDMVEAYTMEASKAARDDDIDTLRMLFEAGVRLDSCNKFGDSLLNIACRRGHTRTVKFLVEEVKVNVHRADDLKRTPLHDACWTHEPNFEIVDILLRAAPMLAVCRDNRGAAPFEYARKHHIGQWLEFLSERRSLMVLPTSKDAHG
jgi:hypothetical protein